MAKEFKGVWIPKEIYQDHALTPTDKLILSDISTLKEYFKSNETISNEIGISVPSVTRSIKKLTKLKYINTTHNGRSRLIKMMSTLIKMIRQPNQNDEAASSKRLDSIQESIHLSKHLSKREVVYPFQEKEFLDTWEIWIEERRESGIKKYTNRGEQSALHKLQKISNHDYKTAIAIINESISQGWRGLFALKRDKQQGLPDLSIEDAVRWADNIR